MAEAGSFQLILCFFLLYCLTLSSEAGLMSQYNSSDKAVYTTQGFSGEAKFVFRSTMQWIDPRIQFVCGRRERKKFNIKKEGKLQDERARH